MNLWALTSAVLVVITYIITNIHTALYFLAINMNIVVSTPEHMASVSQNYVQCKIFGENKKFMNFDIHKIREWDE